LHATRCFPARQFGALALQCAVRRRRSRRVSTGATDSHLSFMQRVNKDAGCEYQRWIRRCRNPEVTETAESIGSTVSRAVGLVARTLWGAHEKAMGSCRPIAHPRKFSDLNFRARLRVSRRSLNTARPCQVAKCMRNKSLPQETTNSAPQGGKKRPIQRHGGRQTNSKLSSYCRAACCCIFPYGRVDTSVIFACRCKAATIKSGSVS